MLEITYKEIEELPEFKKRGDELVWCPRNIDNFMGFTICRIRVTENPDGSANIKYTEEYIMSGRSEEEECTNTKYMLYMQNDLENLLIKNKQSQFKACTGCGKRLIWGRYAYNQTMCWNCFEQHFNNLVAQIEEPQDKALLIYLLDVLKETHGLK